YSLTSSNTGEGSTATIKNMNDNDATILASTPLNAFNNYPVINVTATPIAGEVDHTYDAGFTFNSIGDFVWYDNNKDGTQDVGENGVNNVKVYLLNNSGVKIDSTTTNASGYYNFPHLPNGTYSVQFNLNTLPSGYVATSANQGGDDTQDSDGNTTTGITQQITLNGAENDSTLDLGIIQPVAGLGNFVWYDTDRDGIQDAGEVGVPNVKVYLLNSGGTKIDSTTTNASGQYTFTGLVPGTYSVQFATSTLPAGYVISPANQGSDDAKDSDGNTTTGITPQVTLAAGEYNPTLDLGINQPVSSLGNFVWYDTDRDGIQDVGETGVSGVKVYLLNSAGTKIDSTTTNASGIYNFTNLNP
ncbi:MAG: SdrD B-like domain-containing protein, partial [Dolichospermum sp.]